MLKRLSFVLLALLMASTAWAEVKSVEVRVDGITWPIWAKGLEKALTRLEGVQSAKMDIKTGLASISLKPGKGFDYFKLKMAVKDDAGFTFRWASIAVEGNLTKADGLPALRSSGTKEEVFLLISDPDRKDSAATLQKLLVLSGDGSRSVLVRGKVHEHAVKEAKQAPLGLMVHDFSVIAAN